MGTVVRSALCASLIAAAAGPVLAADRITIEDMLNAEHLDSFSSGSAFSPDGKGLAYTVNAAASQRPTWGYETASLQTMTRVFVTANGGSPREIEGVADLIYSLVAVNAWSPDSGGLLLVATERDGYGLAHYDVASAKVTPLPGRISNSFIPTFAWGPDGRIAYQTIAAGALQRRANGAMLKGIHERWSATWTGESAEVTVHSANPVFASTEEKPGPLVLVDPRSGSVRQIVEGDYSSVSFSPNGRHIGAVGGREATQDALSWNGRRGELQIFSLTADGAKLAHAQSDIDIGAFDRTAWSPSGKSLLVIGRPRGAKGKETRLYVVDVVSGKRRALSSPGLSFEKSALEGGLHTTAWLGERIVVAAAAHEMKGADVKMTGMAGSTSFEYGQGRNTRADVFALGGTSPENLTAFAKSPVKDFVATQGGSLLVVADGALWKIAPGMAQVRLTTEGAVPIVGFATDTRNPPPPAQTAYYAKGEVERVSLLIVADGKPKRVLFDLKTSTLAPLDIKGEVVVTAPDRRTMLTRIEDGWTSSFAYDDDAPRALVTVNAGLKDRAVAPIEKFTYTVGTRPLNGFVVWPPNAKKGVKLPAVVFVYGGLVFGDAPPDSAKAELHNPIVSGQLLAAEGYAVIYPSTPLGAGSDSDQPAQLAEAVIAAIDALAAGGRIDPKRVGVMGQSYGGFSTAALLSKRSDRLAAGVSLAGLYSFFHGYGARPLPSVFSNQALSTAYGKFIEEGQGNLGKPFWLAPDAYVRNSPIFHVETLNSPLLMLHGDLDIGPTDLFGAERMYVALLRAGKKPTLVHYWGEGHLTQSAAAMRDQWTRITTWFQRYLKDAR
jgi:dipeptidyl aminopeptidase/acylaminoacyl peptidase